MFIICFSELVAKLKEAESQKTEIDKLKQQLQGNHPTQANTPAPSNTNDFQLVNITQILMLCLEKMINFFLYSFYSDHAAKLEELETHKSEVVELKQELKGTEITMTLTVNVNIYKTH